MIKQNFTIEEKQMKMLRKHCEDTGLKMSTVVRMGLNLYFKTQEKGTHGTDKDTDKSGRN